jgi:hypothetical protein
MRTPESLIKKTGTLNSSISIEMQMTPKQARVIQALMARNEWISRESVDRIAGASNGPQIIKEIRQKFTGYDGLDMSRFDAIDRDGRPCKPGFYRLNSLGFGRLNKILGC